MSKWDGLAFAPQDTPDDAATRKRSKLASRRDKGYLGHVATLPCLICGPRQRTRTEVHHQPYKSKKGKWHDHKTVPLCYAHHRGDRVSIHALSLEGFNAKYAIDLEAERDRIRRNYLESHHAP